MSDLSTIIVDYSPVNGGTGIPLRTTPSVTFSGLMNAKSIAESIFLEGPDYDVVLGPNSRVSEWPTSSSFEQNPDSVSDFLGSAGYHGIVSGSTEVTTSGIFTYAIFTPDKPLKALTEYTLHITDISDNSIGDITPGVGNTGNGELEFYGGDQVSISDTLNIRITESGVAGIAQFEWWMSGNPLDVFGPLLTSRVSETLLQNDISVTFGAGSFDLNDEYSAPLTSATLYEGHSSFTFTTGSGSIISLPSTMSTSPVPLTSSSSYLDPLEVISTVPVNFSAQVDPDLSEISITFNKAVDSLSVTDDMIDILTIVASNHPKIAALARGEIKKRITVSGATITLSL